VTLDEKFWRTAKKPDSTTSRPRAYTEIAVVDHCHSFYSVFRQLGHIVSCHVSEPLTPLTLNNMFRHLGH